MNPLTALGMTETMGFEGHSALIHTAAASNLGQMLNRICIDDGIALVNIVRREEHVELLESQGATHVINSSSPDFRSDLVDAITTTGATVGFDAVGGGDLTMVELELIENAATQEEQMQLALWLRTVKDGWSLDDHKRYFAYFNKAAAHRGCLLYTSPSPRDGLLSRMPSSA